MKKLSQYFMVLIGSLISLSFISCAYAYQTNDISYLYTFKSWALTIVVFWIVGLLLGLTTCAIPLIIMLSSICRIRTNTPSKLHSIAIAITYVITIAILYLITGISVAAIGIYASSYLQNIYLICVISLISFLLGLISLGLIRIRITNYWMKQISIRHYSQASRPYVEAVRLGLAATIIAAPCVIAPLSGLLIYSMYTQNIILSAAALFFTGIGFGVPLISMHVFGSELIQVAGSWQIHIKQLLGLFLIGISIWFLSCAIPGIITMYLWSGLVIFTSVYMTALSNVHSTLPQEESHTVCSIDGDEIPQKNTARKNIGVLFNMFILLIFLYGILILVGAIIGNTDPVSPLSAHAIKDSAYESKTDI